jgi:hypothetical protein
VPATKLLFIGNTAAIDQVIIGVAFSIGARTPEIIAIRCFYIAVVGAIERIGRRFCVGPEFLPGGGIYVIVIRQRSGLCIIFLKQLCNIELYGCNWD